MPSQHVSSAESSVRVNGSLGDGRVRPRPSSSERYRAAQVCGARYATRGMLAAIASAWVVCTSLGTARAEETRDPAPAARRGESFAVRLSAGGAAADYAQHSSERAELKAVSVAASFRWGGFIDPHFLFGYELLIGRHTDAGTPTVHPAYESEFQPRPHEGYTIVSPLGAFIEIYPIDNAGLYLGASASAGLLSLPDFADEDGALMAGYAAELGYDMSASGKQGLGLFLRYSHWSGLALFSDHGDELSANEVSLGARWAFSLAQ